VGGRGSPFLSHARGGLEEEAGGGAGRGERQGKKWMEVQLWGWGLWVGVCVVVGGGGQAATSILVYLARPQGKRLLGRNEAQKPIQFSVLHHTDVKHGFEQGHSLTRGIVLRGRNEANQVKPGVECTGERGGCTVGQSVGLQPLANVVLTPQGSYTLRKVLCSASAKAGIGWSATACGKRLPRVPPPHAAYPPPPHAQCHASECHVPFVGIVRRSHLRFGSSVFRSHRLRKS
jgi:hypothetical protein